MRSHWRPSQRPPWWPEDQPFPPRGPMGPWAMNRGRFVRRMALFFMSFVLVSALVVTLLFFLLASALGSAALAETLGRAALLVVLVLGVLGLVFSLGAARRLAGPIDEVIEAAGRVEARDYGTRVAERGPREVRALARAFNAMVERLGANEEQRRKLLADVTHELRSPLTIVQGNLEALLDGVYPADADHLAPILDETRVLARLVDDLRTLSLAEAGALALHREPTDLGALTRETLASFRARADRAGVVLEADVAADVPTIDVDPLRAREVLANVVANALRYTPAGGTIRVRVARDGDRVRISVRDSGAGIASDALPHVFDRFYKSEESRGAGLGLAIAKSLVVAHGGDIVADSAPGRGTEIGFTLPLA